IGMEQIRAHEVSLTAYALRTLTDRLGDDIEIHGPTEPAARGGVLSFALRDVHPHDVAQVLDQDNVCVRAGHHCAKPLMRVLGVPATSRASLYLYNDETDVDALTEGLVGALELFAL
ncbi:MAG: aminotransferase class V-fold PLP-dependent enzyme, partial [Acidimicrobiia bacterium]|nr:aminotransferase class V-fold PLP-dependent enzyme [Acidimicrobiia bacterium]